MPPLKLLLSLHDVTPAHLARLARAEALFRELSVTRATYLLVPRYHGEWAIDGDAEFIAWCRRSRPFSIRWCLHGYYHQETTRPDRFSVRDWLKRRLLTGGEGEFLSLPAAKAYDRIERGRKAFKACLGVDPTAFVAPAWLFNSALIQVLRERGYAWTEDRRRIYDLQRHDTIDAPVITWATRTPMHRYGSPHVAAALLRRWREHPVLRIAVHPLDFDDARVAGAIRGAIVSALRHRAVGEYDHILAS